ncbi:MAG: hypothetical protein IT288_08675 [Bdellovibrionales bacterium]|nr:hypothetical protein [Bdellovibrionales bacterium]
MMKLLLASLVVLLTAVAGAQEKPKKSTGTDLSFEDLLIQGRYHFSNESVVTVEEEKVFGKILKIRRDFDDRIEDSMEQN